MLSALRQIPYVPRFIPFSEINWTQMFESDFVLWVALILVDTEVERGVGEKIELFLSGSQQT